MNLLLDTHVFIWWRQDSRHLGREARRAIADADVVHVSAVSAWEVAIKTALGKLRFPGRFADAVTGSGFRPLPIEFSHADAFQGLVAHHTDPFDRMLIAQAVAERLTLVTHDRRVAPYGVPVLWT